METKDSIYSRRSIRKYKNTIIDENILIEAIKAGTKAPSAHNYQPWKFKILSIKEKDIIADELINKTKDIQESTGPHTAEIIKNCPNSIMIYYDDNNENRDLNIISIGACIENIILYLNDLGYRTLWVGNTNDIKEEIIKITNVNAEPISMILVGEKDQDPHERPRKELEDVIIK